MRAAQERKAKEKSRQERKQMQEQINAEWTAKQKKAIVEKINRLVDETLEQEERIERFKAKIAVQANQIENSKRGFFRSTNVFRLIGLGVLLASSFLPSPDVNILGVAGNALALTGVVLVASPTLKEIFKRLK